VDEKQISELFSSVTIYKKERKKMRLPVPNKNGQHKSRSVLPEQKHSSSFISFIINIIIKSPLIKNS